MKKLIFAILLAALLWAVMFSPLTAPYVPFWWMMTGSAVVLASLSALFCPGWWKRIKWSPVDFLVGAGIAAVLWGIFWTGDKVSSWILGFARPQVELIYGIKGETPAWLLSTLLLLLVGPAEEFFWRGYIQRTLSEKWNPDAGAVATLALYTFIHLPSCNFMLVAAAFTAGLFWGLLYRLFPERLWAIVISHAIWDAAVFVWFPI